ncbi:MAG: methionyl aminopeptidase [bacterium]|jgi:methionyl aminopeptidase
MAISLKTPEQIAKMRVAGRLAAEVLDMVTEYVVPGVTTDELNAICHNHIVNIQKGIPATLGYRGFTKSICTSINQQICHGIPSDRSLKKGDIVNIDVTVIKDGWFGDTSRMYQVGAVQPHAQRLCEAAYESMVRGIEVVRPGVTLGDVGHAIQVFAEGKHYSVVQEYCGHGIGSSFHEDPQVLHFGKPGDGELLQAGMTFTIEPMINQGKRHAKVLTDGWTVVTKDRSLSAQWEHTVLVTDSGYELLTISSDGQTL